MLMQPFLTYSQADDITQAPLALPSQKCMLRFAYLPKVPLLEELTLMYHKRNTLYCGAASTQVYSWADPSCPEGGRQEDEG